MPNQSRQRFFDKQVHMLAWKESMSGKNEIRAIEIIESLGYKVGQDFIRQFPIGERFVMDFAFVHEQIAIEIDGKDHLASLQKEKDKKRDKYLLQNNWIPFRFQEEDLYGAKGRFWKNVLKEVVEERRTQWEAGRLYEIEIPNYNETDV